MNARCSLFHVGATLDTIDTGSISNFLEENYSLKVSLLKVPVSLVLNNLITLNLYEHLPVQTKMTITQYTNTARSIILFYKIAIFVCTG